MECTCPRCGVITEYTCPICKYPIHNKEEAQEMTENEFEVELVKAYVPEAEYMSWEDALALAFERVDRAAQEMKLSIVGE